jgi:hypothetical protein
LAEMVVSLEDGFSDSGPGSSVFGACVFSHGSDEVVEVGQVVTHVVHDTGGGGLGLIFF